MVFRWEMSNYNNFATASVRIHPSWVFLECTSPDAAGEVISSLYGGRLDSGELIPAARSLCSQSYRHLKAALRNLEEIAEHLPQAREIESRYRAALSAMKAHPDKAVALAAVVAQDLMMRRQAETLGLRRVEAA